MDDALQAIAQPTRRAILQLVRTDEMPASEIARHFELTRPAISQHLQVLKRSGLVSERRDGTRRFYRARPEGLEDLRAFVEGFWDDRFALLRQSAEAEERARPVPTQAQREDVSRGE